VSDEAARAESDTQRVGTDAWMHLRMLAIARAGGRCESCNVPSNMLCLKVVNRAHGAELELEDVRATCAGCLHGAKPPRPRVRLEFRKRSWGSG
jgi:hypothetical protein